MRSFAFFVFLISSGLITDGAGAAERTGPIRIGGLTDSWGPTPAVVGLRDGLQELGYRENKQFPIGVRFTQGDIAALPAAARELVQQSAPLVRSPVVGRMWARLPGEAALTRIPGLLTGWFFSPAHPPALSKFLSLSLLKSSHTN